MSKKTYATPVVLFVSTVNTRAGSPIVDGLGEERN